MQSDFLLSTVDLADPFCVTSTGLVLHPSLHLAASVHLPAAASGWFHVPHMRITPAFLIKPSCLPCAAQNLSLHESPRIK